MELSILMIIIIAIVAIFFIFKFIKKMIFAVISAVLVVILLFGGVIGIAVFDMVSLSEKTDFKVNLAYFSQEDYILGATVPIKNTQIDMENIKSLNNVEFESLDYKNLDKKGDKFIVKFDRNVVESIITLETYKPDFTKDLELPENTKVELTKTEVLDLIESDNAVEELVNKLLIDNNIDSSVSSIIKPTLISALEKGLSEYGVSVNEAIFFDFLKQAVDNNKIEILETLTLYKENKIEIYPNRLTFSLVKMLPSSFIQNQITAATTSEE